MNDVPPQVRHHALRAVKPAALAQVGAMDWPVQPGEMTAEMIVKESLWLLDAVCMRLGASADRQVLLDGLRYCLRTSGSVAALAEGFADRTRRDLARRAEQVSPQIVIWAGAHAAALNPDTGTGSELDLAQLEFESLCAGHKWDRQVAAMLRGPGGGRMAMQLYNEWIHQLVILRDICMVFDDWSTRQIVLAAPGRHRGLRRFEAIWQQFNCRRIGTTFGTCRARQRQSARSWPRLIPCWRPCGCNWGTARTGRR